MFPVLFLRQFPTVIDYENEGALPEKQWLAHIRERERNTSASREQTSIAGTKGVN